MIINPYNMNLNVEEKKAQNNKGINRINYKHIISELCNKLLEENSENIETNNKKALKESIMKELEINYKLKDNDTQEKIIEEVLNKIFGYGILQKYIDNKNITDIRVVAFDKIYVKELGNWKKIIESFCNEEELNSYIRFCAMKNNAVINTEKPVSIFSDRKNALRLEAGISPVNVNSSSLVIRIHNKEKNISLEELFIKYNMINAKEYIFLKNVINNMKSIVICGKGGSGKTTLLRALVNLLPQETAITTAEETAELYLGNRNIIQRECLPNRETGKEIGLETLTRHSLVMSNDVIVLGELKRCRSKCVF